MKENSQHNRNHHIDGDIWKMWLMHRRDVTDANRTQVEAQLKLVRDNVLRNGRVSKGQILLDVGTGTGLIAFGALEKVLPGGRVIFSDISEDCLTQCRSIVQELGLLDYCEFVQTPMEDMSQIPVASVDIITTRSVLIYSEKKQQVFDQFFNLLKPGGRVSMFEPINRFAQQERPHTFCGYDIGPVSELARRVSDKMRAHAGQATQTLIDFDERDLFDYAMKSGFGTLRLEYEAIVHRTLSVDWMHFYQSAPNPLVLSLEEAAKSVLTDEERSHFEEFLKDAIRTQTVIRRNARAYFVATKDGSSTASVHPHA